MDTVITMKGLSTLDIDRKIHYPNFLGAYAFDELPPKGEGDFSVIVNTEPSTEPGEHWLPLIFKSNTFYFIDSYGRSPSSHLFVQDFKEVVKDYFKGYRYKYNPRMIQDIFSNTCGYYSIYFVNEMESKSMKAALDIFGNNLNRNDSLVVDIVNSY